MTSSSTLGASGRVSTGRAAARIAPSRLLGGIGGLVFVASVVAQNAIRAGFPANDAAGTRVVAYYAAHHGAALALAALYPIGAAGLVLFLGAVLSRVRASEHRAAAVAGAFGAAGIVATFTMLVALDLAISGYVHRGGADVSAVDVLWVLHNAVFGVLLASIGLALAGLTAALAAEGMIAPWWKQLGGIGALLLLVASATTPAIIDAGPTLFVGLIGFLVWLAFLVATAVTLLREPGAAPGR
jgi:hypothetical protein